MGILIYAIDRISFSRGLFLLQLLLTIAVGALSWQSMPALWDGMGLLMVAGNWSRLSGIEFRIDRVSIIFMFMTVLAFWYVYLYVWWSRKGDHKFFFFLSMLQGSLLALFMVNDLFSIYVLLEFITISCSILITYKKDGVSVKAGLYYLLNNSIAMLLFLLGIMFIYMVFGTLNLTLIASALPQYANDPGYRWGIALMLSAICLKSAIFPVFSWLPLAHASAPASVSALLSGLVVKSGIFILLRLGAMIFIPGVQELLLILGLTSGLFGAGMAFLQTDIKRILAYHTISQVGLIVVGLSSPGTASEVGALLHIFNHFLFKSLLFLCAGTIITITGERKISRIRGIFQQNRTLGLSMMVGILGITGAPFFNGSISKAMIKGSFMGYQTGPLLFLINAGTILSFVKLSTILFGHRIGTISPSDSRIVSPALVAALVILSYPAELLLLAWLPETVLLTASGNPHIDFLKYTLMVTGAITVYRFIYIPNMMRLKRFESVRYSFHQGVGILVIFLAFISLIVI